MWGTRNQRTERKFHLATWHWLYHEWVRNTKVASYSPRLTQYDLVLLINFHNQGLNSLWRYIFKQCNIFPGVYNIYSTSFNLFIQWIFFIFLCTLVSLSRAGGTLRPTDYMIHVLLSQLQRQKVEKLNSLYEEVSTNIVFHWVGREISFEEMSVKKTPMRNWKKVVERCYKMNISTRDVMCTKAIINGATWHTGKLI